MPRVMVVEDDASNLEVFCMLMEMLGMETAGHSSAEGLLADLRNGAAPDLIIMDHQMPGMTGEEAIAAIKSEGLSHAPILGVTATGKSKMEGTALLLRKPFSLEEFEQAALQLLEPALI